VGGRLKHVSDNDLQLHRILILLSAMDATTSLKSFSDSASHLGLNISVQLDNAKHSLALFLLEFGVASDLFLKMQSQVGHVLATVLQLASQIRSLSTQLIVISHRFRQLYTQITFQQGNRALRVAR